MTTAIISEIKRFAVHDGDGIRTTVFFKGCPLNCKWCHNPECISYKREFAYMQHKCINCGNCVQACENHAHTIKNGIHCFIRALCVTCGKCINFCPNDALKIYGNEVTVQEILPVLLEDKDFYNNSGGGVTLSGGECLTQAEFCKELLKSLKDNGVHTAVDTCGFVNRQNIDMVIPYTDVFLYDIKAFDEDVHIKGTGQSNRIILENLYYIDDCGKNIEIRIPYIPEYNTDQIEKIAILLKEFKNILKVRVLPYHNYAGSKYDSLGMVNTLPTRLPDKEELDRAVSLLKKHNLPVL